MAGISTLSSARRARRAAGGAGGGAVRSPGFLARRRGELEAHWRTTLDRVTALSVAYHEAAAARRPVLAAPSAGLAAEAAPASPGDQEVSRLARRVVAERQALAEIEAALDRIAGGQYGRCEQCHRPISAGLLTAQPEARFCSACSRHSAHLVPGGRPGTA
jgi:RNA polymerase-binding transcription factor DksA